MSIWINPDIAEIVASLPGVKAEVMATAHKGARKLRSNIAKNTGRMAASVKVESVNDKDAFFSIGDPGALGYNYGHENTWSGESVPGSYVIEQTVREMM